MIVVVQRVSRACVRVGGRPVGPIGKGLLALAAVEEGDTEAQADWCARKVADARIFSDAADKMNRSVRDIDGSVLAVSQFTLAGDLRKGTRPSFCHAARPEAAQPLFERFAEAIGRLGVPVERGVFQAMMEVELVNDGPVTIIIRRSPGRTVNGVD